MKRGLKVFIGLACFCLIGLPLIAQPSSKSIETFVLDNFDNPNGQDYAYGSNSYNWVGLLIQADLLPKDTQKQVILMVFLILLSSFAAMEQMVQRFLV